MKPSRNHSHEARHRSQALVGYRSCISEARGKRNLQRARNKKKKYEVRNKKKEKAASRQPYPKTAPAKQPSHSPERTALVVHSHKMAAQTTAQQPHSRAMRASASQGSSRVRSKNVGQRAVQPTHRVGKPRGGEIGARRKLHDLLRWDPR
jgi:hypothetical protein